MLMFNFMLCKFSEASEMNLVPNAFMLESVSLLINLFRLNIVFLSSLSLCMVFLFSPYLFLGHDIIIFEEIGQVKAVPQF